MRVRTLVFAIGLPIPLVAQRAATPVAPAPALNSSAATIAVMDPKSWRTPWPATDRSRDAYPDGQGRVWFVAQVGNYVANLDTRTGQFRRFEIDAGTNPHNLVVHDGMVFFTGNANNRIVKLDPASGKLTTYMIPDPAVKDPHTMIFDSHGDAWFTAQTSGFVGRFTPSSGAFRLWTFADRVAPYGIVLSSKGQPFFDMFAVNRIGTIDPATMTIREFTLPNARTKPRRIAITSDDIIWYGDYAEGVLGRLDPKTGKVEEFPMPSGPRAAPYAMATDDRDHVWIAETGVTPNRLVSFDTKKRTWAEQLPIGDASLNTIRHMVFDKATRQIWFATDQGYVGRIKVPPLVIHP